MLWGGAVIAQSIPEATANKKQQIDTILEIYPDTQ